MRLLKDSWKSMKPTKKRFEFGKAPYNPVFYFKGTQRRAIGVLFKEMGMRIMKPLCYLICVCLWSGLNAQEDAVAKVNDSSIPMKELHKVLIKKYGAKELTFLIQKEVLGLEMKSKGLTEITSEDIDQHIQVMEKQLKLMQGHYATVKTLLRNKNIDMTEFREKVWRELTLRRLLGNQIQVSDKEITDHYETYKRLYTLPEVKQVINVSVFHRNSPVPLELLSDQSEEDAKKVADEVLEKWQKDEGYIKKLWEEKSFFIRGFDEPYGIPFDMKEHKDYQKVFATSDNTFTEVIRDRNGFQVYKVVGTLPARVQKLEEVKNRIRDEIISTKIQKLIAEGAYEAIEKKYNIQSVIPLKEENK